METEKPRPKAAGAWKAARDLSQSFPGNATAQWVAATLYLYLDRASAKQAKEEKVPHDPKRTLARAGSIVGTLFLIGVVWLTIYVSVEDHKSVRVLDTPAVAEITDVEERRVETDDSWETHCTLTYRYTAGSKSYATVHPVSSKSLCRWKTGQEIEITYDSANPALSTVQEPQIKWVTTKVPWIAGGIVAAVTLTILVAVGLRKRRKQQANRWLEEIPKEELAPEEFPPLARKFNALFSQGEAPTNVTSDELLKVLDESYRATRRKE